MIETKICTKCGEELPKTIDYFFFRPQRNCFEQPCKKCRSVLDREYRERNKERISCQRKEYREANKEKIRNADKIYRDKNKETISKKRKERYQINRTKILDQQKKYKESLPTEVKKQRRHDEYERNKSKYRESSKRWVAEHKDRVREYMKDYHENRVSTDPLFKLSVQVRGAIYDSFRRNNGYRKDTKTAVLTGVSSEELTKHLLKTYENNYGKEWDGKEPVHIDHIIPLATAKSENDVRKLCHYTNLQLLKAEDNLAKSNKLNYHI